MRTAVFVQSYDMVRRTIGVHCTKCQGTSRSRRSGRAPSRAAAGCRAGRSSRPRCGSPTRRASAEVTIRRIARELRSGAMSLYHYFDSRDELLDLMGDTVAAEMLVPELPARLARRAARDRRPQPRGVPQAPWLLIDAARSARGSRPNLLRHIEQSAQSVVELGEQGHPPELLSGIVIAVDDYTVGYTFRELAGGGSDERGRRMATQFRDAYDEPHVRYLLESGEFPMLERFISAGQPPITQPFEVGPGLAAGRLRGLVAPITSSAMAIEYAEKVRRIPVYPAADGYASEGPIAKLASNESPYPPIPAVVEAVTKALTGLNRYPDPTNAALRAQAERAHRRPGAADRGRQRLLRHPARRRRRAARAGRRARLRVAVVQRLPAPGGGVRRPRDRGAAGRQALPPARQDGRGDHRRHAAGDRLQPEQPDLDGAAAGRDRRLRASRCRATSR